MIPFFPVFSGVPNGFGIQGHFLDVAHSRVP